MKKKYLKVTNFLCASVITLLGLGACKSTKNVDAMKCVYGPPPGIEEELERNRQLQLEAQQRQQQEQQRIEQERQRREREIRVVYGPPPGARVESVPTPDDQGVYDIVDKMPQFPGGQEAMDAWVAKNQKELQDEGRVMVSFIVEKDGSLDGLAVLKSATEALDKEALRLVKAMPKWEPGMYRGEAQRVRYVLSINLRAK